jgi:hypothetical protein
MNLDHFKKLAKKQEKQSYFLLIVFIALILVPVLFLAAIGKDEFTHRMTQAILEKGVVLGIASLLPFILPGFILFLVGQIVLRTFWKKKPDATCIHCKTFLLNRSFWIRETGRCFHCGKRLFPVTDKDQKRTDSDSVILEENQKLEIAEIRRIVRQKRKIIFKAFYQGIFLILSAWLLLYIILPGNIGPERDTRIIITVMVLFVLILFLFVNLYKASSAAKKKYPLNCPNCNYYFATDIEKFRSITQFRRCPSCNVEIIRNPNIGSEKNVQSATATRPFKASEYIRLGNLHQKYVLLICLIPLGMSGGYFSYLDFWEAEPKDVTIYDIVFAIVLFSCFAFFYWLNGYYFKKKYKIVCPHCSRNLISGMIIETVKSGNCYHCGQYVIEED